MRSILIKGRDTHEWDSELLINVQKGVFRSIGDTSYSAPSNKQSRSTLADFLATTSESGLTLDSVVLDLP